MRWSTSRSRSARTRPSSSSRRRSRTRPALKRHEISRFDERGPAWAWDWLEIGEHVGTHFDAPIHWISGRDGEDVASRPARSGWSGPAVVIDKSAEAAADPDYLLTVDRHSRRWRPSTARCPRAAGCCSARGWDARPTTQAAFLNADQTGPHTPGPTSRARGGSPRRAASSASAWRRSAPTPAPPRFDPPFPVHHFLLGAGKYGLTQLANLAQLPPTGAVIIVAPLKLVDGTGSPARVLALVPRA